MSLRSLLAVFDGTAESFSMLDTACYLAMAHHAQLKVLHVLPDPALYKGFYGGAGIVSSLTEENTYKQQEARAQFQALAGRHGLPVLDELDMPPAQQASLCFMQRTGIIEGVVAHEACFSELAILAREPGKESSTGFESALTAALFDAGRPLLLLTGQKPAMPLDETIAIAWKQSRESMRAIMQAMPFIIRAKAVHVLMAYPHNGAPDKEGEQRILAYLKLRGINAAAHHISRKGDEIGAALLEQSKTLGAGLLVMGAYGQTRLREMVLGGVSEYMLDHSDLPVLMAH